MGLFDKNPQRDVMSPEEARRYTVAQYAGDPFEAMQYGGGYGASQEALGHAQQKQSEALNRPFIFADSAGFEADRAKELEARQAQLQGLGYFSAMAQGQAPSVANAQYRGQVGQVIGNAANTATGARGGGASAALATRAAMQGSGQQFGQLGQQYSGARMGEQLTGMQGLTQGANALTQGDLSRGGLSARWATDQAQSQLGQRGANMDDAMFYAGMGQQIQGADQSGRITAATTRAADAAGAEARARANNDADMREKLGYTNAMVQTFAAGAGGR